MKDIQKDPSWEQMIIDIMSHVKVKTKNIPDRGMSKLQKSWWHVKILIYHFLCDEEMKRRAKCKRIISDEGKHKKYDI